MVREIGEEFWSDWIKLTTSTDSRSVRVLYRVVEIVKVRRYGYFGDLIDVERVSPIQVEYLEPPNIINLT